MANKENQSKTETRPTYAASTADRKYPKKSIINISAPMIPTAKECRTVISAVVLVISGGSAMPTA